jgi:hypothetical protein
MLHMTTSSLKRRLDPRLVVGLALVVGSAVGVTALMGSINTTQPVYVATKALAAGHVLDPSDVRIASVGLGVSAASYVREGSLTPGAVVTRPVGSGELLPTDAVGTSRQAASTNVVVQLNAPLAAGAKVGSTVDVWAATALGQNKFGPPQVIIQGAQIAAITQATGLAASNGGVRVEIVVPQSKVAALLQSQAANDAISLVPTVGGLS